MTLFNQSPKSVSLIFIIFLAAISVILFIFTKHYKSMRVCKDCNLILISIDTLRTDHMGIYGYEKNTTPNIDKWANRSIVYTNMYTIFPLTAHSLYTLFSGNDSVLKDPSLRVNYPIKIDNQSSLRMDTMPKILQENGYETGAFVTNPVIGYLFSFFRMGFNKFEFINTSQYPSNSHLIYNNTYSDQLELTNQALKWLNTNQDKKIFLWLHYLNPHHPYNPPKEYVCELDQRLCGSKDKYSNVLDPSDTDHSCLQRISEKDRLEQISLYDAEILTTDKQVGRILEEIEKLGLDKKTIVVLYSDHGEGFDHEIYHHGKSLYQSGISIPFIIRFPDNKPRTINAPLDNTTILQGLFDFLGLEISKNNTEHILRDSTMNEGYGKKSIFISTASDRTNRVGVIEGDYKYIESSNTYCLYNNYTQELYDLAYDPQETDNLASRSGKLSDLMKKVRDFFHAEKDLPPAPEQPINSNQILEDFKNLGY